jgi:hypothetical protein
MQSFLFRLFFSLAVIHLSFSCSKRNPNPELLDPIYLDLLALEGEAQKAVAVEEGFLAEHEKALKSVVPQTGQIKYAEKRYWESINRVTKARQQARYYEVKRRARKLQARRDYSIAYSRGLPWPPPSEYSEYSSKKAIEANVGKKWSAKDRVESLRVPEQPQKAAGGH